MKLIGICGKSFSGKTTFSKMLSENHPNVAVIHVDDLMDEVKKNKVFKLVLKKKSDSTQRLNPGIVKIINSNKLLFEIYMYIKSLILRPKLYRRINEYIKQGKEFIVIESVFLDKLIDFREFDYKILIKRYKNLRREGAFEREECSEREFDNINLAYYNGVYNFDEAQYDEIVNNNGDKEELQGIADKIYGFFKMLNYSKEYEPFIPKVKIRYKGLANRKAKTNLEREGK